jgi:NTP pyrophosphatase (non-canonical NTP hydrolase)
MNDSETTVAALRQLVFEFVQRRDWHQFHSPKNLAMSMAIETAELMEHFQWLTLEQSRAVAQQPSKLAAVGDELADVLCYALAMANELGLDVSTAIRDKMQKNERKYPAEEFRGRYGADDPRPSTAPRTPGLRPGAATPGQPDAEAD